jgi:hypothetical protein
MLTCCQPRLVQCWLRCADWHCRLVLNGRACCRPCLRRSVGVVVDERREDESEDDEAEQRSTIRRGLQEVQLGSGDEDSDFD